MSKTSYNLVFDQFKDKITDPDLIKLSQDLQIDTLVALMNKAISKCNRVVKKVVDLSVHDDEILEFQVSIPDEVMDILTEWMVVFWLQPFVNNLENLRNNISTKEFSLFSPANLLEKIGNRYDISRKYAKSITNEYSFIIADMGGLKT